MSFGGETRQMRQITGSMNALMQPSLHDPYVEPPKAPKIGCSTAAAENLERNRGKLTIIGSTTGSGVENNVGVNSARGPRVLGREGAEILQRSHGTIGPLMSMDQGSSSSRNAVNVVAPRVKGSDGEDILHRSINGTMATLLNADKNRTYSSPRPAPRIPSDEAGTNAIRNRGVMNKVLDTAVNRDYQSARHCGPRASSSAGQTNALNGRGTMGDTLAHSLAVERQNALNAQNAVNSQPLNRTIANAEMSANRRSVLGLALTGQLSGAPVCEVRIKGDRGTENYQNGTHGTIGMLLGKASAGNGQEAVARPPPPPRVNGNGMGIAQSGKTGTVHRLLNSYGQLPVSGRQAPRVKSDARQTALNGRGRTMAGCINPHPKPAKRPTRRKLGLSKKPRPKTAVVGFGSTAERPVTASVAGKSRCRPTTA